MKKLILFISLVISITTSAQTYNGNITLTTQQDVDDFSVNYPTISGISGVLTIGDYVNNTDITNLNGLQGLSTINTLAITKTNLTQISGFNNLVSCNKITIYNNSLLVSISGFNLITNIDWLNISANPGVSSINMLPNVLTINQLNITEAQINNLNFPSVQNINILTLFKTHNIIDVSNGLPNLINLNYLRLIQLNSNFTFSNPLPFANLKGLEITQCNAIQNFNTLNFSPNADYVKLSSCNNLNDISPLSSISSINEINFSHINNLANISSISSITSANKITIIGTKIVNLDALSNITTINDVLNVSNNGFLTSISGLNHPVTFSGTLFLNGNQNLSNCAAQAICNYLGVNAANATIAGNATGCNSISEVTYACNPVPLTKIRTQDCGLQTTTFNQLFYCNSITGATYEFRYRDVLTNVVTTRLRPNTAASFGDAGLLDINRTYSVRVRAILNGVYGNYGDSCLIYSPIQVPLTKIRTIDCGLQTTTFNQLFYADAVSYATNYEFEFVDISTNVTTYKVRPNNAASLGDAGLLDINKIYNVRVRAKVGNNWGAFGTICQIKSPTQVPLTKIRTLDCGLQTTTFTQLYYADAVSYATNYEFEYVDINTNAITYRVRPNNAAYLGDAGLNQYNKIYNVRVRAKVGNNWGAFGTVCQIKSPINITQVNSAYCNIAYSIPDLFYCDPIANANAYEFEFTNTTTNVITTNIVTTTANSFATAGLPYYSKTYSVRVRARIGTTWGSYGAPCILKSICSTCLRLASNDESTIDDSKNTSSIAIYPNPTTDILNISDLTESSTINVFNVSGQLVLTKSSIDTNEKIDLSALDSGIYIIVIEGKNGELAKRQRVVLAK